MNLTAFRVAAALLALAIFLIDTLTPLEGAVAVLYVVVVLLAARTERRADIALAALAGMVLTIVAYLDSHGLRQVGSSTLRAAVSLSAVGIAAILALQSQKAIATLSEQARLLNLSHDMIFVRDQSGLICFWNDAAEQVYGWARAEAVGRVADDLLATRYPEQRTTVEAALLAKSRWDGRLEQQRKDGRRLIVESRWALQHDVNGRPVGVLETHTDVTEQQAAHAAVQQSERRYRRMFDGSRIGVLEEDWSAVRSELFELGLLDESILRAYIASHPELIDRVRRLARIVDVNPALLRLVAADKSPNCFKTADEILAESDRSFANALVAFARGDDFFEGETEIVAADGRRVPVLFAITFPGPDDDGKVLVFIVDYTERRKSQDELLAAQASLAHAMRVATLGELTASIAHEVNQPLTAVVASGEAGMRWLKRSSPNLGEVEAAIVRIISEGRRASEIVKRIRSFLTKAPSERRELDVALVIEEASLLVDRELARERVELRMEVERNLPPIMGDRIQLQQVLVNLMINAEQAMAEQESSRLLTVGALRKDADWIEIRVQDSGPGIAPANLERLFDPFFTTKSHGMGMGLAICRTTIESHGGKLGADIEPGAGAVFRLILPVSQEI